MIKQDDRKRPLIIAGPCSAESEKQTLATYLELAGTGCVDMVRAGVWKPRTNPGSFEGAGEKALKWLAKGKTMTGLPFGIEVANAKHVRKALAHGADMVWLGARTTVNPFAVQEIADALRGSDVMVLIKNPLTPDVDLWQGALERIANAGIGVENIALVHRGFPPGTGSGSPYRNPPAWHLALEMRRRFPEICFLCDPSHIAGRREYLLDISQKAADLYYDGLIIESHTDPETALSDRAQQLSPEVLADMLSRIKWRSPGNDNEEFLRAIEKCRDEIDEIDSELFALLSRRMRIAGHIGRLKKENDVTILQRTRWNEIVERMVSQAERLDLSPDFIRVIMDAVHLESINHQNSVMNEEDPR